MFLSCEDDFFSPYKPQATLLGQSRSIHHDMGPAQSPDLSLFANLWNLSKGGNNEDIKRCFLNFFAHQLPLPTTFQVKLCLVCPPLFLNMLPRSPTVVVALRFDGLFLRWTARTSYWYYCRAVEFSVTIRISVDRHIGALSFRRHSTGDREQDGPDHAEDYCGVCQILWATSSRICPTAIWRDDRRIPFIG